MTPRVMDRACCRALALLVTLHSISVPRPGAGQTREAVKRRVTTSDWSTQKRMGSGSSDGRYAAYPNWDADGALEIIEVVTGRVRNLTPDADQLGVLAPEGWSQSRALSRDGEKVAFTWYDGDCWCWELRTIGCAGYRANEEIYGAEAGSPIGRGSPIDRILWARDGGHPDGRRLVLVTDEERFETWMLDHVVPARSPVGQGTPATPQDVQERYRPPTPLGLDEYYPVPESNELTGAKVELGRRLFFDGRLSVDGSIACASCHRPDRAFSDTVAFSPGVVGQQTARNAPSILNRAYGTSFFRDGRTPTLEATVLMPIVNPAEMGLAIPEALSRLRADPVYRTSFEEVFEDGITRRNLARALASFVRTLRSGGASFDRYVNGDREALTREEVSGFRIFAGKANCVACHLPPTFSDEEMHNTGVSDDSGDPGRYGITGDEADRGVFKTPTLRNLTLTAPYMHDGSMETLEEVIEFYDRGGNPNPNLDPEIRPLRLTEEEKGQLLAFLRALTGVPPSDGS